MVADFIGSDSSIASVMRKWPGFCASCPIDCPHLGRHSLTDQPSSALTLLIDRSAPMAPMLDRRNAAALSGVIAPEKLVAMMAFKSPVAALHILGEVNHAATNASNRSARDKWGRSSIPPL